MRIAAMTAVIALAALSGCAETPSATQSTAAAPVVAAKPAASAPSATAATAKAIPGGISPELYAKARQQGYRAKVVKERTIFCRDEAPIGSRLTKDVCVSIDQLEESVRQAEVLRDQLLRGQTCGKAACGGS